MKVKEAYCIQWQILQTKGELNVLGCATFTNKTDPNRSCHIRAKVGNNHSPCMRA